MSFAAFGPARGVLQQRGEPLQRLMRCRTAAITPLRSRTSSARIVPIAESRERSHQPNSQTSSASWISRMVDA